ncbi:MAG: ChbG/HpnK family deacetylase, partial [Victivallaceae bacterium]|nr:ChbG/HpnK family deacetylase [Victivallaceae bacterium]
NSLRIEKMSEDKIYLIVKGDDFGYAQNQNAGIEEAMKNGIVTCASMMAAARETLPANAGPEAYWKLGIGGSFEDAVRICRENPDFEIGVHLVLDHYKPVLPPAKIPSLVSANGFFHGWGITDGNRNQIKEFLSHNPSPEEVEQEESAQVECVLKKGLRPTYIDQHNGVARSTPELAEIQRKIAGKFALRISLDSGEKWITPNLDTAQPEEKCSKLLEILENLSPGLWLLTTHPMMPSREMEDIPWWDNKESMASHAEATLAALTNKKVKDVIARRKIKLTGYGKLTKH